MNGQVREKEREIRSDSKSDFPKALESHAAEPQQCTNRASRA